MFDLAGLTREELIAHGGIQVFNGAYFLCLDTETFVCLERADEEMPFMAYQFRKFTKFVRVMVQGVEGTLPPFQISRVKYPPDGCLSDFHKIDLMYDEDAHNAEMGPFAYAFSHEQRVHPALKRSFIEDQAIAYDYHFIDRYTQYPEWFDREDQREVSPNEFELPEGIALWLEEANRILTT